MASGYQIGQCGLQLCNKVKFYLLTFIIRIPFRCENVFWEDICAKLIWAMYSTSYVLAYLTYSQFNSMSEMITIIVPILEARSLRHKEIK